MVYTAITGMFARDGIHVAKTWPTSPLSQLLSNRLLDAMNANGFVTLRLRRFLNKAEAGPLGDRAFERLRPVRDHRWLGPSVIWEIGLM